MIAAICIFIWGVGILLIPLLVGVNTPGEADDDDIVSSAVYIWPILLVLGIIAYLPNSIYQFGNFLRNKLDQINPPKKGSNNG